MTVNRISRTRLQIPISGGVTSALLRRTGRDILPIIPIVDYFREDADTPVIEMLRATKPVHNTFRQGENIHVSDVISKCIRKIAIMRRMDMRHPQEDIMDGQAITYAIGDAIHDYVKAKFVQGHPDKVWARWTCPCEKTECVGTYSARPIKTCQECGLTVNKHNEIAFVDPEYKLSGSPDLLLLLDRYGAIYLVEIKSMSAELWKELARPMPDHVVQTAFYWHLLRVAKVPIINHASILYVNKEFSFKFPYKEFMINPSEVNLDVYWEDLKALKIADEGGELPPRVVCGAPDAPEAKKCPVCVTCFGCR